MSIVYSVRCVLCSEESVVYSVRGNSVYCGGNTGTVSIVQCEHLSEPSAQGEYKDRQLGNLLHTVLYLLHTVLLLCNLSQLGKEQGILFAWNTGTGTGQLGSETLIHQPKQ